jgi:signal transduction histidine kinase
MSSATIKHRESALPAQECPFGASRCEFMEAVSQGLHQVAQPLTVLQGVLELALIEPSTLEGYRRSLARAMEQWKRAADSIDALRQLLYTRPRTRSGENFSANPGNQTKQERTDAGGECTHV